MSWYVIHDGYGRVIACPLDGDGDAEKAAAKLRKQGRLISGPMPENQAQIEARAAWSYPEMVRLRSQTKWSGGSCLFSWKRRD